ncbi:hypothetical protein AAF712_016503, partial [Marasmius tenuissimus]
ALEPGSPSPAKTTVGKCCVQIVIKTVSNKKRKVAEAAIKVRASSTKPLGKGCHGGHGAASGSGAATTSAVKNGDKDFICLLLESPLA